MYSVSGQAGIGAGVNTAITATGTVGFGKTRFTESFGVKSTWQKVKSAFRAFIF